MGRDDLIERAEIKAGMIEMGDKIAWGSDSAIIRELAAALKAAEAREAELHRALLGGEPDYSMLSHKSFLEMIKLTDDARARALGRALRAEADLAAARAELQQSRIDREQFRLALGKAKNALHAVQANIGLLPGHIAVELAPTYSIAFCAERDARSLLDGEQGK